MSMGEVGTADAEIDRTVGESGVSIGSAGAVRPD
jgi:hypothetical protein